jgi:Domain of unknown function (DUF4129)
MTQRRSRAGDREGGARSYPLARMGLAALLIAVAAVALRGGLPRLAVDGPYIRDELPIATVLEAVVVSLLIVILVRRARAPTGQLIAARLREMLRSVLIAASVAVPLLYLVTRTVHVSARPNPVHIPQGPGRNRRFHLLPQSAHGMDIVATVIDLLVVSLLVAAIVTCVVVLLRRRWTRRAARQRVVAEFEADDSEADLKKAVEYGWLALRELDDARGAIIACYLAMEQSLAKAGTARGVAETPDELLARAAGTGLVRGTAAARLTAVFYEARFSTRQLPPAHRDTAEQALAELAASLSERVP